jgi:hypothetical protein
MVQASSVRLVTYSVYTPQIALLAPKASPTFTGTVTLTGTTVVGGTPAMVGLSNVTDTSDANKPVSAAQQLALDTKILRISTKRTITTAYTLVAGDALDIVLHSTSSSAVTITLPQDSAVTIAQEIAIPWRQYGTGQLTFAAGSGATIVGRDSAFKSVGRYSEGIVTKVAANTWLLSGDVTV